MGAGSNRDGELRVGLKLTITSEDCILNVLINFQRRLCAWEQAVTEMENWLAEGRAKIDLLKNPPDHMSPEDRYTCQVFYNYTRFVYSMFAIENVLFKACLESTNTRL
jgi:hypothetical protein